jgi:cell wall-associated NlpC family hydrolase
VTALDDFLAAEKAQESGGNYGVVNHGTGALGAYQVLPSNVNYWAQKYLGISVSPQQFLSNPALQDRLVGAVLGDYVNRYGFRGAASAWYSGNPNLANNYGPQNGGPSIGAYVDGVLSRMGKSGYSGALTSAASEAMGAFTGIAHAAAGVAEPTATAPTGNSPVIEEATKELAAQSAKDNAPAAEKGLGLDITQGVGAGQLGMDSPTGFGSNPAGMEIGSASDSSSEQGLSNPTATAASGVSPASGSAPVSFGTSDKVRLAALQMAQRFLGTPYVYGGTDINGIDCSGLIYKALAQVGVQFPRGGRAQAAMGQRTDISKLQPGDLVAFNGGEHVALYAGNNQVIEAAHPGTNVSLRTLGTSWDLANGMYGVSLNNLYN